MKRENDRGRERVGEEHGQSGVDDADDHDYLIVMLKSGIHRYGRR